MADDIVTRLRGQRTNGVICEQAADEIERLRMKCQHLETELARLERLSNG